MYSYRPLLFSIVAFVGVLNTISAQQYPYQNPELSIENRVNDLMQRLTLTEKVAQMNQFVGLDHMRQAEKDLSEEDLHSNDAQGFYKGVFSHDVEEMVKEGKIGSFLHVLTWEEANHLQKLALQSKWKIPLLIGIDAIHGNALYRGATVYPSPIGLAASWDPLLVDKLSKETAMEMRATGSHWAFTPNIDVLRDPRWGRVGETFGEDPFLVGEMGAAMIKGLQGGSQNPSHRVIACAKHLIGGGEPLNGLNAAPMDVSERTLKEVFLPPFKKAIDAGVYSIMAAHNELNGIPCHMHKGLMTDLFRNQWDFKGFYVSDWMDIERIETLHRVAKNIKEACYLSVDAGIDMHMHGLHFVEAVVQLVEEGKLSESRIDQAVEIILKAKFQLGLFEQPLIDSKNIKNQVFIKAHQNTAKEAALKSIVLLKNKGLLPLKPIKKSKKILITGPNAFNQTPLGDWHSPQPEQQFVSVFEGVKSLGEKLGYQIAGFDVGDNIRKLSSQKIEQASHKAKQADLTIVVVGDNSMRYKWKDKTAGENMARSTLNLAGKQLDLLKAVHQSGKPYLVVLVNGKPIAEPWLYEKATAVMESWEAGSFAGEAIAKIIFGEANPSGKLPLTIPRSVGQLQMIYNHKPSQYFHKYAFEKSKPLFPFGFGLSYTQFKFTKPTLNTKVFKDSLQLSVKVSNVGDMNGEVVVQMYIRDHYSAVTRPVKELKAFKRVHLKKGESKEVNFEIQPDMLAFLDRQMQSVVEEGVFSVLIGTSSDDKDLKSVEFEVPKTFAYVKD